MHMDWYLRTAAQNIQYNNTSCWQKLSGVASEGSNLRASPVYSSTTAVQHNTTSPPYCGWWYAPGRQRSRVLRARASFGLRQHVHQLGLCVLLLGQAGKLQGINSDR